MSIIKQVFDQGTSGATITTGNSAGPNSTAFTAVTGMTFSNVQKAHGSLSGALADNSSTNQLRYAMGGVRKVAFRHYRHAGIAAAADHFMIRLHNSSDDSSALTILLNGANTLRINTKTTNVWTASAAIPLNAFVRLEGYVQQGVANNDGIINFAYYLGDSTTAIQEVTLTAQNLGGDISDLGNFRAGKLSGDVLGGIEYLDSLEIRTGADATGLIGPFTEPLATPVVTITDEVRPTTVGGSNGTTTVTWPAVSGATKYDAYIANTLSPTQDVFTLVDDDITSPFTFTSLAAGPHSFGIKARP